MFGATLALFAGLLLASPAVSVSQNAIDPIGYDPPNGLEFQGPNEYLDRNAPRRRWVTGGPLEVMSLGILVRNARAKLSNGKRISGVAVVEVLPTSPARDLLDPHRTSGYVMTGVVLGTGAAAAVLFPPAIMLVPLVVGLAESYYDLIIGIDGKRVTNTFELLQAIQDAQPGDRFYLTVVRKGRRVQVSVRIPRQRQQQ